MPDVLHLDIQLSPVLQLRLLRPPQELPADMANVIVGRPGPAGDATLVLVGSMPISGHSAVAVNSSGELVPADCTAAAHQGAVLGVVVNAYAAGSSAEVKTGFPLEHLGWSWSVGPVFVGAAGQLTQALPPGALFSQTVGRAVSATRVLIDLQPPITIA